MNFLWVLLQGAQGLEPKNSVHDYKWRQPQVGGLPCDSRRTGAAPPTRGRQCPHHVIDQASSDDTHAADLFGWGRCILDPPLPKKMEPPFFEFKPFIHFSCFWWISCVHAYEWIYIFARHSIIPVSTVILSEISFTPGKSLPPAGSQGCRISQLHGWIEWPNPDRGWGLGRSDPWLEGRPHAY